MGRATGAISSAGGAAKDAVRAGLVKGEKIPAGGGGVLGVATELKATKVDKSSSGLQAKAMQAAKSGEPGVAVLTGMFRFCGLGLGPSLCKQGNAVV